MFKQLIDNAIDAMASARGQENALLIKTRPHEHEVEIIIHDTGPGIAEDIRNRVFEPFFTTKGGSGKQAGMGLSMVRDVINEHAGSIEIDPAYLEGCRFEIRLPVSHQSREA